MASESVTPEPWYVRPSSMNGPPLPGKIASMMSATANTAMTSATSERWTRLVMLMVGRPGARPSRIGPKNRPSSQASRCSTSQSRPELRTMAMR